MQLLPGSLQGLASFNQFILYRKSDKCPVNYKTFTAANAHDPSIWLSIDMLSKIIIRLDNPHGIGFVLTERDPYFFIDIDNCVAPCGTKWTPLAEELLKQFSGAAVEVSQSKRGLHIIGRGKIDHHMSKNTDLKLEFYTSKRYIALTGTNACGNVDYDCSAVLPMFVEKYFAKPTSTATNSNAWTIEPCESWDGYTDDAELIVKALNSKSGTSVFGAKASFSDLWNANEKALAEAYPPNNENSLYDESSADAALASHLAFWTGKNCERIRELMLQSNLKREKWEREDYLTRTILNACALIADTKLYVRRQVNTADFKKQVETEGKPETKDKKGTGILSLEDQKLLFEGCVYVRSEHKILVPGGDLLSPDRFRAEYGGFSMVMDSANAKVSRNAFEVFTESQLTTFPRAHNHCFKPALPSGHLIKNEGELFVNTYYKIPTKRLQGDVKPFARHIDLLFPTEREQKIFLSYIAANVQYPGVKFQWCPVLQGVEGNGKTLFSRCLVAAIGSRHCHYPKAKEITSKFNDWLYGKIFISVEDLFKTVDHAEIYEILKPMITSEKQEIEPKGGAKVTRDICANFMINTNHKDALVKNKNDRRFAIFYLPQQTEEDLNRDGLTQDYFVKIYRWLNSEDGFAIVNEFLSTYEIEDEFNPATHCNRAPKTSSTEEAINISRGAIADAVMEQIESGMIGFKGGFVSSHALNEFFKANRYAKAVPTRARREFMNLIEYDYPLALSNGRCTTIVQPDNNKPRLYIKKDHPLRLVSDPKIIMQAYEDAQKS